MNKLNKLLFTMSLIDKVSAPLGKVQQKINNMTELAKIGARNMAVGFTGVAASVFFLSQAMQPAIEMDRAIGEVRSLGVRDDALKQLTQTALKFSTQYGESATDFVRSSYDIQSSMDGITGRELAEVTKNANLFAKGTKGDVQTATEFFGKMYNIFKADADSMGKVKWSQKLANESALAVKTFRTNGNEFAAGFASLGATASSFGISTAEQFAIIGQLQGTLSGSEAGTSYVSFLQGVGRAQQALGLQFTDSQGRMLPMVTIIEQLEGKFGDLNKLTVKQKDMIKNAFGRKEAVKTIELISQNVDGLRKNIKSFSEASGMDQVTFMAESMADPWQRFNHSVKAVQISFGQALLPVLVPLVDTLSNGAAVIQRWTQMFPHLSKAVATGVLVVVALVAAIAAYKLILGSAQLVTVGFKGVLLLLNAAWWTVNGGLLNYIATQTMAGISSFMALKTKISSAIAVMKQWRIVIMLTNTAMWANPITWIVALIIALIAVVVYLYRNWDELKVRFADNWAFQIVMKGFEWMHEKIQQAIGLVQALAAWWTRLMDKLAQSAVVQWLAEKIAGIVNVFRFLIVFVQAGIQWWKNWLSSLSELSVFKLLGKAFDGIIDLLNMLPFVNIGGNETAGEFISKSQQAESEFNQELPSLNERKRLDIPVGGLQQQITNNQLNNDSGTRVDQMHIHTDRKLDQEELDNLMALAAT